MSRYHEKFYEPEFEQSDYDLEQEGYEVLSLDDYRSDMGYLEDDLEFYGEYDDDFGSVWR